MTQSIAVLGAGGHGKIVAEIAQLNGYVPQFLDDRRVTGQLVGNWRVSGSIADLDQLDVEYAVVAIGNNRVRWQLIRQLEQAGDVELCQLTHPWSSISSYASVEDAVVVAAGAVVCTDAKIGKGAIVNTSATIDHDCILDDCVHVSPGANLAGGVTVGECSWIGIGACVREGVVIGRDVVVGAGAVVVSSVPDGEVVVGNPARVKTK